MNGLKAFGVICAALGVAFVLDVGVCLLPENGYQRWQLLDGTIYERLRWDYERIHCDPRPVDIAIVGPSETKLGLSAARVEQQVSLQGRPANVANFSVEAAGRNIDWAIIDELYKSKSPKVIVIGIHSAPYPYGHPAFRYVAPADAIAFPPAPLLHSYLYDVAYLPSRKMKLFGASLFPDLFGLRKQFDPEVYARTRTDYSSSFFAEGKWIDMEREIPRATLIAQAHYREPTLVSRALVRCCNDGDDHVYIREIAREANAHGTRLMFDFLPAFNGSQEVSDRAFLEQYGKVLNNGDLSQQDRFYENWSHLNHSGAMIASDRLANEIAGLHL
jgi:hypothetical protein